MQHYLFTMKEKLCEMLLVLLHYLDRVALKMLALWTVTEQNYGSTLSSDVIESRQNDQSLVVLVTQREQSYFYTGTCNEGDHFGIVSLRKCLCEKVVEVTLNSSLNEPNYNELCKSLQLGTPLQIVRATFKDEKMYINYIIISQKDPLGKIEKHWWTWEYQETKGNLSHIHFLVWMSHYHIYIGT